MPKQPAGINKSKRVQTLLEILHRWGRMNKTQIDQRVAAALACDPDVLSRALYRDLDDLVHDGRVRDYHFTRDGQLIDEFDPSVHRNSVSEWAVPGAETKVLGESMLNAAAGLFYASPRMNRDFKIEDGKDVSDFRTIHIYFSIGLQFFCLKLNEDALPASIVLGRKVTQDAHSKLMKDIEERFGKRASLLLVPIPNVSGSYEMDRPGHLVLTFETPSRVQITDLGSKNGTSYCKLMKEQADELRRKGSLDPNGTRTRSWGSFDLGVECQRLDSSQQVVVATPLIVYASAKFPLLVV